MPSTPPEEEGLLLPQAASSDEPPVTASAPAASVRRMKTRREMRSGDMSATRPELPYPMFTKLTIPSLRASTPSIEGHRIWSSPAYTHRLRGKTLDSCWARGKRRASGRGKVHTGGGGVVTTGGSERREIRAADVPTPTPGPAGEGLERGRHRCEPGLPQGQGGGPGGLRSARDGLLAQSVPMGETVDAIVERLQTGPLD